VSRYDLDFPPGRHGRFLTRLVATIASRKGGGPTLVESALLHRYRDEMAKISFEAAWNAFEWEDGTKSANGGLGTLLGVKPNSAYAKEPPLARAFHLAHAADWCVQLGEVDLQGLRAHANDSTLDGTARAAACSACEEIVKRHLRRGADADHYDTGAEPLCHFLAPGPAYVYREPSGPEVATEDLASDWCGCVHSKELAGKIRYAEDYEQNVGPDRWEFHREIVYDIRASEQPIGSGKYVVVAGSGTYSHVFKQYKPISMVSADGTTNIFLGKCATLTYEHQKTIPASEIFLAFRDGVATLVGAFAVFDGTFNRRPWTGDTCGDPRPVSITDVSPQELNFVFGPIKYTGPDDSRLIGSLLIGSAIVENGDTIGFDFNRLGPVILVRPGIPQFPQVGQLLLTQGP
jgi:hypothetical protein